MPATFVRSVEQSLSNGTNNITVNTTDGSAIVVAIPSNNAGGNSVTSVSYQGMAGRLIKAQTSTYNEVEGELWLITGFVPAASGTLTVTVTRPAGIMLALAIVLSATADDYASASIVEEYSGGDSYAMSQAVNSMLDCITIGLHVSDTGDLATSGSNQTRIDSGTGTSFAYGCDYKAGASPTQTMSFTRDGPYSAVLIVASFTVLGAVFSCPGIIG